MWVSGLTLLGFHWSLDLTEAWISAPFFSFWTSYRVSVFVCLLICIKSLRICSLVFILFSFFFSDSIIQNDLSSSLHTLSSACLNMWLNFYGEFFYLDNVLFSSRISVWFFLKSFLFINILTLSICPFLDFCPCFSLALWSYLWQF